VPLWGLSVISRGVALVTALYNEIDPFAAAWLRELISAGLIADGIVDERPIQELKPSDVEGFTQFHAFAGIGGWSYALRLAGWPDSRPVWTGSCPCQPFSASGRRRGFGDSRHLWPEWYRLIRESRPATVFGEQVASKDGLQWFDLVSIELEDSEYAVGAADLCAAGVGAPHIRQRLWFVAEPLEQTASTACGLANAGRIGLQAANVSVRPTQQEQAEVIERGASYWRAADWFSCADGSRRPVESGTFPLAHGIPGRVGRLRGYGNAIVPQVAQAFIEAYLEIGREIE